MSTYQNYMYGFLGPTMDATPTLWWYLMPPRPPSNPTLHPLGRDRVHLSRSGGHIRGHRNYKKQAMDLKLCIQHLLTLQY